MRKITWLNNISIQKCQVDQYKIQEPDIAKCRKLKFQYVLLSNTFVICLIISKPVKLINTIQWCFKQIRNI